MDAHAGAITTSLHPVPAAITGVSAGSRDGARSPLADPPRVSPPNEDDDQAQQNLGAEREHHPTFLPLEGDS